MYRRTLTGRDVRSIAPHLSSRRSTPICRSWVVKMERKRKSLIWSGLQRKVWRCGSVQSCQIEVYGFNSLLVEGLRHIPTPPIVSLRHILENQHWPTLANYWFESKMWQTKQTSPNPDCTAPSAHLECFDRTTLLLLFAAISRCEMLLACHLCKEKTNTVISLQPEQYDGPSFLDGRSWRYDPLQMSSARHRTWKDRTGALAALELTGNVACEL